MKFKVNLRREVKTVAALLVLFFLIGFAERKQNGNTCKNIVIELENAHENHFVDQADVQEILDKSGQTIIGKSLDQINLKALEAGLEHDTHIEGAELYGDVKGNLMVNVKLRRPVARLVRADGPDAYIAEDGVVMGVSDKFSSRVMLISGSPVKAFIESGNMYSTEEGKRIMEMIQFIREDQFWTAQIAQLDISGSGKIKIFPQVTGQLVEFGKPEDIEQKFKKLMIFYKEILPQMGWTEYDKVNVEFEGQVIAQ